MIGTSRKAVRQALATYLEVELVGAGRPVQAFYAYPTGDFGGQSPVVTMRSAGSDRRDRLTFEGGAPGYTFAIAILVAYPTEDDASWTEADVENALDDTEEAIYKALNANQRSAYWEGIDYTQVTATGFVTDLGGNEYRSETILVKVS